MIFRFSSEPQKLYFHSIIPIDKYLSLDRPKLNYEIYKKTVPLLTDKYY